ncbi:hypothetical protein HELRODRAFT_176551 [Helobdella robusta]|uniref:Uncharacterized protein n=1 Tax=Helobdella robusta TaxID=6412 RepID=T1FAN0_HELRO|nr:hypothetical protein HELRODRAFT_176551 [Helobdella robusta]ESN99785.1 hypothetical protein HELRODRAFT_176551 [Helobdella robusta]
MAEMEFSEEDDCLYMDGNFQLISLNLSNNFIREDGINWLWKAVSCQECLLIQKRANQSESEEQGLLPGLLRLVVDKNNVHQENEALKKLNEFMAGKHPFKKLAPLSEESSVISDSKESYK